MPTDKWVSTLHRVVLPSINTTRYSMAFFVNVNADTQIESLSSCLNDNETSHYPRITAKEHLMAKHLASMNVGEDDLDMDASRSEL